MSAMSIDVKKKKLRRTLPLDPAPAGSDGHLSAGVGKDYRFDAANRSPLFCR
jgi:hypothetical protein